VGLFSRRKPNDRPDAEVVSDELDEAGDLDAEGADGAYGSDAAAQPTGPFDRSSVADDRDYLNLGSIWLKGQQGMELRLEINEQEQQITGVTAVLGESAVQLQAFAAPRTE